MIRVYALFLLISLGVSLQASSNIDFFEGSWEEAVQTANDANKLIFLDIYTDWCAPCKKLTKYVFTDPTVAAFYNENFINYRINAEKGEGIALAEKYNVQAYPTLLFVALDYSIVHQLSGFQEPKQLVFEGKIALNPDSRLGAFDRQYEDGDRSPAFLARYAQEKALSYNGSHIPILDDFVKASPNWKKDADAIDLIWNLTTRTDSRAFTEMAANKKVFYNTFGEGKVDEKIQNLVFESIYDQEPAPGLFEINKVLEKAYPKEAKKKQKQFKLKYFREKGDRINYAHSAVDYFNSFKSKDPFEYLDAAQTFNKVVEDESQLKQAIKWAKRANRLEKHFDNLEVMSHLYQKIGKTSKAKKAATAAFELAKKTNQTEQLDKKLLALIGK